MKRLNYITADEWWDTDVTILDDLAKHFDLYVYVLSPAPKRSKYAVKHLDSCKNLYNCIYHFRKRNPLCAIFMIYFFVKVCIAGNKKNVVNFCMFGWHPFLRPFFLYLFPRTNTIISFHNYKSHVKLKNDPTLPFYKRFKYFHFHSRMQMDLYLKDYHNGNVFYTQMLPKDFGNPQGNYRLDKNGKRIFLFFGLIRDYKRLDLLINAINQIESDNILVVIAGYCGDFSQYNKMIADKNKFRCDIRLINNSEIADLFTISDFLVLPYDDATQSGPSLIALNYGLPIIASDLPAFKELISPGETGFLFKRGDQSSLSGIIKNTLEMSDIQVENMKKNQLLKKSKYVVDNQPYVGFLDFINNVMDI